MKSVRPFWSALLVSSTLLVGGCAKSSYTVLNEYPSKAEDCPIEVLSLEPKERKFVEVAILNAQSGKNIFSDRNSAQLIAQLKKDACEVGADAIILRSTEDGRYAWGQGGFDAAKAAAVAIKWVEE